MNRTATYHSDARCWVVTWEPFRGVVYSTVTFLRPKWAGEPRG